MTDLPDGPEGPLPGDRRVGTRRPLLVVVAVMVVAIVVATIQVLGLISTSGNGTAAPSTGSAGSSGPTIGSGSPVPPGSSGSPGGPGASPSAAASAPASASNGFIAVVDDEGALSTVDDHGGSRVAYPMPGVIFGYPAWSPDGSRIAVVGSGPKDTAIYVYTVRASGTQTRTPKDQPTVVYRSADRPPFYLYWTPDGRSISFLATEASSISLRIAPADGSAPLDGSEAGAVLRKGAPLYFDWVEASRVLLHVGLGSAAFGGEVDPAGDRIQQSLPATGNFRAASASTDHRYLAYVRSVTDTTGNLVVAARDGSSAHELPVFGPAAFVFDPTGDRLATISSPVAVDPTVGLPIGPLRLVDAGSGAVRTLLSGPVIAAFWSPDGHTIAAIRVAKADDNVTAGTGIVLANAVVPRPTDGSSLQAPGLLVHLSFIDAATGEVRSGQVVHLADHFVNQLLPYFDQYALSHQLWSPDSASILLPLVDATGRNQLVVVPVDGSTTRPVADGAKGFWSP